MPLKQEQYNAEDRKRLVLVAEDDEVNQKLIGFMLKDDYEVVFANDGAQALRKIRQYRDSLSLILLDYYMPKMNGIEVLDEVEKDSELKEIPVIMMTAENDMEFEALSRGVIDFINKPFSHPDVLKLRIKIGIELTERRRMISTTERDPLTDLYTRDFFYSYVNDFNKRNKDIAMDALVLDVDSFHLINERYGNEYGDCILCSIAGNLQKFQNKFGAILCRRISDTFLIYTQSGQDYQFLVDQMQERLAKEGFHLHIRLGVFQNVDKNEDMIRQFSYAKMAADTIKGDYTRSFAIYDRKLKNDQLFREQLVEDFRDALTEGQFEVYFQPKYSIQAQEPYLYSAEALVRWKHPVLGLIGPGDFISLFEENGLIKELDCFVWDEACARIAEWKKKYGITIPVSVNVSRIDMLSSNLIEALLSILKFYELKPSDLVLEITESAYVNDTVYIIEMTRKLREAGFLIGMDDFGTGYSSLGMLSDMPIDALKLDRSFIIDALKNDKNRKMLKMMMDIADSINAVVVAEGVETRKQLDLLKSLGCDIIQGFYFSKPIPAKEFERLVRTRAFQLAEERNSSLNRRLVADHMNADHKSIYHDLAKSLSVFYDSVYYVDLETDNFIEYTTDGGSDHMRVIQTGRKFFDYCIARTEEFVAEADKERIVRLWHKDHILKQLKKHSYLSVSYRTSFENREVEFSVKIIPAFKGNNKNLVVGMTGIDKGVLGTIRTELMRNNEVDNFVEADPLTGAGSILSFIDKGIELDEKKNAAYGIALFEVRRDKQRLDKAELEKRNSELVKIYDALNEETIKGDIYRSAPDELLLVYEAKQDPKIRKLIRKFRSDSVLVTSTLRNKKESFTVTVNRVYEQLENKQKREQK